MRHKYRDRRPQAALLAATLSALCVACASGPGAPAAGSPQQVFDTYVAAVDAGDLARIDALISPAVERPDFAGCKPEMNNKACLVFYIKTTVIDAGGRIQTRSARTDGDTLHAVVEVPSRLATQLGVQRIVGTDIVRVQAGQITAFKFVPDFADEQTAAMFGKLGIGPRAARPLPKPSP